MRVPLPDLPAAAKSGVYRSVRALASKRGIADDFQWFCALLEVPSDLRWLPFVVENLKAAISVATEKWKDAGLFARLQRVAKWIEDNRDAINRIRNRAHGALPLDENRQPMKGYWNSFSLYSMMCQVQENGEGQDAYSLLQMHILVAREREIKRRREKELSSHIEEYEQTVFKDGLARVSKKIKFPHAADNVRLLMSRLATPLLEFMRADLHPDRFGIELRKRLNDENSIPAGEHFAKRALSIANYCIGSTSSREVSKRTKHGVISVKSTHRFGDTVYSPRLIGRSLTDHDPDDEFQSPTSYEALLYSHSTLESFEDDDEEPGENTTTLVVAVGSSSGLRGMTPEQMGRSQASLERNAIDRESLPWSIHHLRPAEIASTLLKELRRISDPATRIDKKDFQILEIAALVAVCLETGRKPERVLNLPYGVDPQMPFSLRYLSGPPNKIFWAWNAIEKKLTKVHVFVDHKEVSRAPFLIHTMSSTTERLLGRLIQAGVTEKKKPVLFTEDIAVYLKRIGNFLTGLDACGRLTVTRISKMQWSILGQLTGNDYAKMSMVLGDLHRNASTPLHYALMPVEEAHTLFAQAVGILWGKEVCDGSSSN